MRDDRERLKDILEAIERIHRYASRGRGAFDQDELIQNWIVSHIQMIGEACRSMSEALRQQHPEVPWIHIIEMRHILVHEYFGIDLNIVWSVVQTDLDPLAKQIQSILASMPLS